MTSAFLLLLLASPFQAAAILNVSEPTGGYSISLFYAAEAAFAAVAVLRIRAETFWLLRRDDGVHTLVAFWAVCTVSVLVGSTLFSGTPVYTAQGGIDTQIYQQTPLRLNLYMVGQVVYMSLHVAAYFAVCKLRRLNDDVLHKTIRIVALIVTIFACWQLLHKEAGIYYPSSLIYRSTGNLGNDETIGQINRLSATFMEPSFYGLYAAALATYFLFCARKFVSVDGLVHLVMAVQCVASTSSTGIVALAFGYVLYVVVRLRRATRSRIRTLITFVLIVGGILVVATKVSWQYLSLILQGAVLDKVSTLSYIHRQASNDFAWRLFINTFGLGVGLGGNRPSSFALYLLSDVGVIGTVLFVAFCFRMIKRRLPENVAGQLSDRHSAARAAIVVTLAGMVLAAPDLSTPQLWMWFFIATAFAHCGGVGQPSRFEPYIVVGNRVRVANTGRKRSSRGRPDVAW